MALFGTLGPALTAGLGAIGNIFSGGLGAAGQLGSAITGALVPAQGPVVQQVVAPRPVMAPQAPIQVAAATRPIMPVMASAMTRLVAPILVKIATSLGRRTMTLRQAVRIVRRMGSFIGPTAVAAALGITSIELAELIMAASNQPSRRMNPANIKALRRSMRRIQSFHRLCVKADQMRGGGRRSRRRLPAPGGSATIVRAG